MARGEKKRGLRLPFEMTRRRKIIVASAAAAVLVALAAAIPFLIRYHRAEIRKYSGAEADASVQLLYDMDRMGDYRVVKAKLLPDGQYSEHIVVQEAIDIRLWRDFERPKLPCREQMAEKYPDLTEYSRQKVPKGAIYSQRGRFKATDEDGGERCHTVVLLRRGGWDFLVDFSVKEGDRESYADEIDEIIDHMILIP